MSSMQEDIQCAGSDTRPPMLDRTDFESWQQRIRLYCLGKDNGENIMKSIKEGPFHMGTVSDVIAGGTEGAVQQGPVRARVLNDLSAEEKERYKADIRATNILLQGIPKDIYSLINHYTDAKDIWENVKMILEGSELTKDDRESQLYDEFEHFRQIKGETIQGYYVRFTKLINDMRNIKMTMPRMQLNSKFVNNMLPEWSRFITEVKLNRGLKESNFDQLYAYLKQHEVHANENRIMMERFIQPNNDPLALVSDASVQQYPTQSSKSPQSSTEPYPADNFQMDSGSSSTENLIESLSNTLALLTQSYKSHLPQTNNQLRASSNARNKAMVQDGKVVVQDVRGRYNATNQGRPFQRNNARGNGVAGNVGGQNRGGIINPGQAKPIKCYNCNGLGHIARECPRPKRLQDSDYFKDKMLLMQAQESGAVLDEEQSLFLAGEQVTNVDDNVDDSPENDLALNVDHVFEADECDAFDSDVDEGPITQTMFMTNLTSEDLIYDEAGTSYDSNTPSEVHDHDTFVNHLDEYHEVHEMQTDEQHNYVVDSDADYTSNSNIIPYDQYMEDNEDHVVQRDVSSVRNDALMSILDEMHEQGVQSRLANKPDMVVNDLVTSELARYKELVKEYEKRAKFKLTDRERKIDEQMRIIISDRNRKETSLKSELHSAQILLSSTVDHYKSKTEEVTLLKKDFKQKEDKFLEEFLDINKLKDKIEDRLYKQDQSVQTVHMLCKPKSFYDEKHKILKVLVAKCDDRVCEYNAKDVTALIEQNDCVRIELEKVKQHYKELYDSIKITRAHTSEKTSTMLNEIESLKAQLRSKEPCFTSDYVKPKVLAPGMYAIDVKPIPHPLKNNRSAHLNYISHLKESVETVREIVEEARVVKPLDNTLNYACQYTKLSQELLEYVIGTCPKSFNERDNKAPSTPVTRKKQVTFSDKPGTSSSNTQKHEVHQKVQQTNIPVIPSTGVNDSTEASGSKPRSNTKKNRILPAKKENKKEVEVHLRTNKSVWTKVNRIDSSISYKRVVINSNSESVCKMCDRCLNSTNHEKYVVNILSSVNENPIVKGVLNKGKQIWKPKNKLTDNRLNKTKRVWKETGKLFADIGYQWRSTGKNFTLGEMFPLTKLSVKCSTISANQLVVQVILWYLDSGCSKHMTGNCSKLMNFVEKFIGTVRFGNDHFGAIMGYGDYVIGQFCDSDLEVAFRKHTCFVRDINGADILKGSRSTNLYTISIDEMMKSSPICLLSKASKSKSWLWHRRLNHLNFGTINDLARKDLEDLGKFQAKADIGNFCLGMTTSRKCYRIYNKENSVDYEKQFTSHSMRCISQWLLFGTIRHLGMFNSAEPNQVNLPPDHLRRGPKIIPLDYIVGKSLCPLFYQENNRIEASNIFIAKLNKEYDHLQMVVKTAFLKCDLQKKVFVSQQKIGKTWIILRTFIVEEGLYDKFGLKQAPRAWYDTLLKFLLANNFFKGAVDPTCGSCGKSRLRKKYVGKWISFLEIVLNTMAEQNVPAQPPTRTDEQIVPRSQWLTIGKSNLLFNAQKIQKNPIFQISVDILKNTNFFQALTASANVPAIYLQQFWKTMSYNDKTGVYSCQLDEQWFDLSADLLRKALAITPVNPAHPFELILRQRQTNTQFLQILWGLVTQTILNMQSDMGRKKVTPLLIPYGRFSKVIIYYLASNNNIHRRPDSAVHHTGDDYVLGNLKFVPKGESVEVFGMAIPDPLITEAIQQSSYYPKYLEMVAENTKKTPQESASAQSATKRATPKKPTTTTPVKQSKPAPPPTKKPSKRKLPQKVRKGKPSFQLVDEDDEAQQESIPHEEGNDPDLERAKKMSLEALQEKGEGEGDDADLERAIKLSLDPAFLPQGRAPVGGVTIRDPVSETTSKLHEVVGKGKAVVTEEQVAHSLIDLSKKKRTTDQFILVRRDQTSHDSTTGPSSQPEDDTSEKVIHESSSTSDSERTESETETAAPKGDKDQGEVDSSTVTSGVSIPVSDPEKAHEALAGPDPEPMKEDQTGSDSGKLHVSLAGPNPEHMDDEFLATAYPKVHENLKLITDERVIDDKPESHSGSMSSMKNLDDTFNFGDQFLYDKPTEDDQEKSKVREESESTIPDPDQTVTSTPPVIAPFTDVTSSKPSLLVTPPPINTEATTITTSLPEITPFIALQLRVARLEQEMSEVKKTDHSADVLASIRSQVPTAVDKYLGTKLDDALLKVLERHTADLIEKYSVLPGPESIQNQESEKSPKEIIRAKKEQDEEKQDSTYSIRSTDKVDLEEFDLKSALFSY
ncbi:retrovirus-related pol polyprotein from transposon TNT 1-94 [Tanacetum coccineum]|uniref:Retrovirus-related pol polyprotein from transposon TNT 1-94 n=1 Tax=Tanacetum coccineum TaxID=301880 RepID=A0ABQ4Z9N4_9ASTR